MASPSPLSAPDQIFVEHFAEYGHTAGAAQAAGAPPDRAAQVAEKLLGQAPIQQALQELAQHEGISAAEATWRLSHWGRGSVAPFLRVGKQGQVHVDLSTPQAQSHYHLLRRVVERRYTEQTERGPVEVVETEIELYSALDAVHRILQLHGSYAPVKYDITTNGHNLPGPVTLHAGGEAPASESVIDVTLSSTYGTQKAAGKAPKRSR